MMPYTSVANLSFDYMAYSLTGYEIGETTQIVSDTQHNTGHPLIIPIYLIVVVQELIPALYQCQINLGL